MLILMKIHRWFQIVTEVCSFLHLYSDLSSHDKRSLNTEASGILRSARLNFLLSLNKDSYLIQQSCSIWKVIWLTCSLKMTFMSFLSELRRQRDADDLCEIQASQVYISEFKTSWGYRKTLSNKEQNKKKINMTLLLWIQGRGNWTVSLSEVILLLWT